jgi:uncharacterized protein YcbK (DUF882 family)
MSVLFKAARWAAVCIAVSASTSIVQAESDSSWIAQSMASAASFSSLTNGSASSDAVRTITRKRASTSSSALARLDDDKPRPSKGSGSSCVPAQLQSVLSDVEAKFGSVRITSTCRTASANRAAGGAPQSLHLFGQAVDFRVSGSTSAVMAFLSAHADVGGLKHYGGGLFHIDTGDRRPF